MSSLPHLTMKRLDDRGVQALSRESESSSNKDASENSPSVMMKDSRPKSPSFSNARAEDNSACSKTSSNTKLNGNLVRIPLAVNNEKI